MDWASFGHVMIGAARRALSAFVLTLTFSRWFFLRFFLDQSLENFLRGHVYAFEDLHGTSRYCLYDNLRSAVLERYGEGVRFNPRLLELAAHYHFAPRACRPARGNEKGAVERTVRYVRDSFFAARSFTTVEDLNRQALVWRDEVAGDTALAGGRSQDGRRGVRGGALAAAEPARAPLRDGSRRPCPLGEDDLRPLRPQRLLDSSRRGRPAR